ncbi:N-acetylneuraminate synthase family protein [Chloroflexota bacterium]
MKIGNIEISQRTLVVAEIGNNHEGNFDLAKQMIEQAVETGVDAVKFQTIRAERFIARTEEKRFQQVKGFELSDEQFRELALLAQAKGLLFLSTPFDFKSVDMLDNLVPAYKIASGDLTSWYPFLEYIARKDKPIILSTGMSDVKEIAKALEVIARVSSAPLNKKVVLLHCVTSYPVPIGEANLLAIPYLKEKFRVPVGYSDHTLGTLSCQTAVALGACVIEKHFTYRKENQTFRDHALAANLTEMRELVDNIRLIEASLGKYSKGIMECEKENKSVMRRSLAARKPLRQGETMTPEALTFLRPGNGIPPERWHTIIGHRVTRNIAQGTILKEEDIEQQEIKELE